MNLLPGQVLAVGFLPIAVLVTSAQRRHQAREKRNTEKRKRLCQLLAEESRRPSSTILRKSPSEEGLGRRLVYAPFR